jgi:hypothetical protein
MAYRGATERKYRQKERYREQGYGPEEGSEEEARKVSAGKTRREKGEETESWVSDLRATE